MTRTAMYNNYVCSVQFVQSTVLCTQNNDLQAHYFHNYVHDVLFAQSIALYIAMMQNVNSEVHVL